MKTEYLNRAVTISRDSLHKLMLNMAKEKIGAAEGLEGVVDSVRFAATLAMVEKDLAHELFTDDTPITIRGEDYAAKAHTALRSVAMSTSGFTDELNTPAVVAEAALGEILTAFFAVEDKLFGSDHVEEHESVKEEAKDE